MLVQAPIGKSSYSVDGNDFKEFKVSQFHVRLFGRGHYSIFRVFIDKDLYILAYAHIAGDEFVRQQYLLSIFAYQIQSNRRRAGNGQGLGLADVQHFAKFGNFSAIESNLANNVDF